MILLDTSVIVDYWRKPSLAVKDALSSLKPCICGVVLAELLHGASNEKEIERTETSLAGFARVGIPDDIWRQLGLNLAALRKAGLKIPFQDVLLATVAIAHGMELWTLDAHYTRIQTVLTDLKLFRGPH